MAASSNILQVIVMLPSTVSSLFFRCNLSQYYGTNIPVLFYSHELAGVNLGIIVLRRSLAKDDEVERLVL